MANLIQATVVNIGGNPQPVPLSQAFLTSGIIMQEATIASSQVAGTQITYYSGPFSNTIFYVTETVSALVAAANTGTTSQVQVTVYEINGDSLPVPVSFGFPASGVVLKESVHGSINTILTCAGVSYGVSETEASIVTAANVGGGGGGAVDSVFGRTGAVVADAADYSSFYWAVTGTTTLTGDVTIDQTDFDVSFQGSTTSFNIYQGGGSGVNGIGASMNSGGNTYSFAMNDDSGFRLINTDGVDSATVNMTTHGLDYSADYSANYTSRSLIDKGYADGHYLLSGVTSDGTVLQMKAASGATKIQAESPNGSYNYYVTIDNTAATIISSDGSYIQKTNAGQSYAWWINSAYVMFMNSGGSLAVGTSPAVDASAKLDVQSTTLGFLPPRMTTAQKNAIGSPSAGLVVYDTDLNKLCIRVAAAWQTITSA